MNKFTEKNKIGSNRSFGIVFFIVFLIIGFWPLLNDGDVRYWSLIISFVFLILSIINSKILKPLNIIWFKFGNLLGSIIAPIVMFVIFFLVVTPLGIFMKILGKDILNIKFKKKNSYWIKREKVMGDMRKQF